MKSEFLVLPSYCFLRVSKKIYSISLPISYFQVVIPSRPIIFFSLSAFAFPGKDVTCRGFPFVCDTFCNWIKFMSYVNKINKVSIFNAVHPECIFILVLENDCYDIKPPLPGCNYLKAWQMMSLERK